MLNESGRLNLKFRVPTLFLFTSVNGSYEWSKYDLKTIPNRESWTVTLSQSINWSLPFSMNLLSDISYSFYGGYATNNKRPLLWNAEISKQLFKNKMVVSVKGYDLLNQIQNIKMVYGADFQEEISTNMLQRYIMFNVGWRFGKFK